MRSKSVRDRHAIIAGVAGNVMEWYDFSVYGYFAANIGRHFFPTQDAVSSLIAAFGVFAAGFLMRPLGSLVFGHIGDKMGRKMALTASVALMAIPTFLIGALPTYQQIGVTASVLLVLMRLLQGLSVGGEYTTSSIFLVERSAAGHRGFFGSFAEVGACSGILLGSALSALVTTVLDRAVVDSWGWRIPFLIGVTIGIVGLYIRRYLVEETGPQRHQLKAASPIREAFTEWRTILRLIGLGAVGAVGFYMSFVYITTYLRQIDHIAQSTALDINTIAMVVLLLLLAPVGALSGPLWPEARFTYRDGWDGLDGVAAFLDAASQFASGNPSRADRVCHSERVLLGHHPSHDGRVGARASTLHCAVARLQHGHGDPWRVDANGRRVHDQAKPIRPFPGLPADGCGCGFIYRGHRSQRDIQNIVAGHCCGAR